MSDEQTGTGTPPEHNDDVDDCGSGPEGAESERGVVDGLVTAPSAGASPVHHETVEIVTGGVAGDRYCESGGYFELDGCAVTLVAGEALDAVMAETGINVSDGRHRRNIVVRGFGPRMDDLLEATVAIGDAVVRPTRRRPPCARLESLAGETGLAGAFADRGGLCCSVVEPGRVSVGAPVRIRKPDPRTAGMAIADRLRRSEDIGASEDTEKADE